MILLPLSALPPSVSGIPVWYQATFFRGLLAVGVAGIACVVAYWLGILHLIWWNAVDGAMLILFTYMALRTFWLEFIPQTAWIQIAYLAGVYGVSRLLWSSISKKSLQLLLSLLLVAGIAQAGYGLGQLYGLWPSHHHLFPLTGTFYNPGPYSGWLACMVPVAVYGILQNKRSTANRLVRYLSWGYLFLAALVLLPALSRAAIIAAIAGSIVVAWPRIKGTSLWQPTWVKVILATVVLIGMAGLYMLKKDSADGRLLIYKVTADMIAEAPVLGWGWDGFPRMYNNFQAIYFGTGQGSEREKYLADNVTFGFNEVLEFTAEMGIIGLLLASAVVVLIIRKWRQQIKAQDIRPVHYLGLGVLAAWMVFALFSYPMSIPALAVVLPVGLSGFITSLFSTNNLETSPANREQIEATRSIDINSFAGLIFLGISLYGFYWVNHYRPLTQDWMVANANQELQHYDIANSFYDSLGRGGSLAIYKAQGILSCNR